MEDPSPTRPPTVSELRDDPVVQLAIEGAWNDSKSHDPETRHEEGGWIYMNLLSGEITVRRAAPGHQSESTFPVLKAVAVDSRVAPDFQPDSRRKETA